MVGQSCCLTQEQELVVGQSCRPSSPRSRSWCLGRVVLLHPGAGAGVWAELSRVARSRSWCLGRVIPGTPCSTLGRVAQEGDEGGHRCSSQGAVRECLVTGAPGRTLLHRGPDSPESTSVYTTRGKPGKPDSP